VPLEGDLDLAGLLRFLEEDDPLVERLLRGVEVLHEVDDPAGVLVVHLEGTFGRALVTEVDLQALRQEGHLPEPLQQRLGPELRLLEDRAVGPERDRRTLLAGAGDALQRAFGPAAIDEDLDVAAPVAVDLELELR